jgi:broad specificity phosphatase PhoE
MALIYLIRHARPLLAGVMLGRTDPPLERYDHAPLALPVDTVFSSPLRRARQTAELLFPGRGIRIVPELAEISFGDWDGLSWPEIETRWPEQARAKREDWFGIAAPGGESWSEFEERVAVAWRNILAADAPSAVVAHLGVNSVLSKLARGTDPVTFSQEYSEVISIEIV